MLVLATAAVIWLGDAPHAQAPKLPDILARVAAYVHDYVPRLANVVAEETYAQERKARPSLSRRLTSDLLLVPYPAREGSWMVYRDVKAVDGQPVSDQQERVISLFVKPTSDAVARAAAISEEGRRHHLPGGTSLMTNPLTVVAVMQPQYQARLRFGLGGDAPGVGPGIRVVRFEELQRRWRTDADPIFHVAGARGSAWVELATGRILRTDVMLAGFGSASTVTTFRHDERLGIMVPDEMRTSWPDGGAARNQVTGTATYSDYRRFEVQTEGKVLSLERQP